jgi:hypothetical protein
LKTFNVRVVRKITQFDQAWIAVEAIDEDDAAEQAEQLAETGDVEWSDCDSPLDDMTVEVSDIEEAQ